MRSPCTATKSSPHSLQLEKACAQQRRPNAAKNKINKFTKKKYPVVKTFLLKGFSLLYKQHSEFLRGQQSPIFQGGKTSKSALTVYRQKKRNRSGYVSAVSPGTDSCGTKLPKGVSPSLIPAQSSCPWNFKGAVSFL